MKNINGYGSVIKLSGKRRKKYAIRITEGWKQEYGPTGAPIGNPKQIYKYLNYYENRKDAIYALANFNKTNEIELYEKENEKTYVSPSFIEMWHIAEKNRSKTWSTSTYQNYKTMAEKYAKSIHHINISDLDYQTLQNLMNEFMELGKTHGTCKLFKCAITMILNEGIKMGYIDHNPASTVKYKGTKNDVVKKAYDVELIKKLYEGTKLKDQLLLVLVYTGMRINELLRLKTENIYLDERYMITGSKTDAGKGRIVPIHKCLIPIFKGRSNYEYFCGNKELSYETARYWIEDEEYTFHEARHTFVSLADEYELNEIAVKRIVGHSTTNITDRIYTHKTLRQLLKEIDKLPYPNELN